MGKPTGFMEYERVYLKKIPPRERIENFNEFGERLSKDAQEQQGARCMDCGVPFCQTGIIMNGAVTGCPLNNLIPEWNDLIYSGNWDIAIDRLHKTNNFPEFTGRVCPAPCEAGCTCAINDNPVAIKDNELSIIENAYASGYIKPSPPAVRTGKKVAVIGSGPSGLAAADQLNRRGHNVTVYERSDRVGGLLMYGIPQMKLEKNVVLRRVSIMEAEGVEFKTDVNVGHDIKADDILGQYDSVLLACGASNPRDINAPGRNLKGIYFAVDFLKSTTKSLLDSNLADNNYINAKDKHVIVIGGGDTGNDCVGTSIRHGCASVSQLEVMPKPPENRASDNPWPQWAKVLKTDYGQEEAIEVFGSDPRLYQTTIKEFIGDENGVLQKAIIVNVEFVRDESGRMVLKNIEGSEREIKADIVLIAAGFLGCQDYIAKDFGVELDARGNVNTAMGIYKTNVSKVFTAGDMHRGQSLVVWAIREGREAAREVDEFLMGYSNL